MQRTPTDSLNAATSLSREPSDPHVPQEHTLAADADPAPRDWSQWGRRVLAEAWRRTTEDLRSRSSAGTTPADSAPQAEADS